MSKNLDTFYPDCYYHVFNRTNNRELLFTKEENYSYFLEKYSNYLNPLVSTLAYCLLGNHFHLLIKVRSEEELLKTYKLPKAFDCHKHIATQFGHCFNSYSKSFNKQENRYGNLFQRPFKRVQIINEAKFAHLIYYIHANPEHHKIALDFKSYHWSSYQTFLSNSPSKLAREEVLEWFGGLEYFIAFHKESHDFMNSSWVIED